MHRKKPFFADKLLAKKYVEENFKEVKCSKLYQKGNKFKDLIIESLPESFVLKTNHACCTNLPIFNKNNLSVKEKNQLEKSIIKSFLLIMHIGVN